MAIRHALREGDWNRVDRYATRLETYTRHEPLPWANFMIAKGRTLGAWGGGERGPALADELRNLTKIAEERRLQLDHDEMKSAREAP
jgi:hypothetical protein